MLRECKVCGVEKPYNATAKAGTKAAGFMGAKCWDCYRAINNLANQTYRATPENRSKRIAASVKRNSARLKTDKWFALRQRLCSETWRILNDLAKGRGTNAACLKLFGADRSTCQSYFEKQLAARGWTWQDYADSKIEADHKVPFGLAQDSNELRTLALLENIQFLTPVENRLKSIDDGARIRSAAQV